MAGIGTHDNHQPFVGQSDGVWLLGVAGACPLGVRYGDRVIEVEPRDLQILRLGIVSQVLNPEVLDLTVAGDAAVVLGIGCPPREADQGSALAAPMRNRGRNPRGLLVLARVVRRPLGEFQLNRWFLPP